MNSPILLATKNAHKAEELAALIAPLGETLSLADWETQTGRTVPEPVEDGQTFTDNALIKAKNYALATGLFTLADDSGLCVYALEGGPGVKSARYGGAGLNDPKRVNLLLSNLENHLNRQAYFISVLALAKPDGHRALTWQGRLSGLISRVPRGEHGFGYDPVFYCPQARKTLAEMTADEKNKISHRAKAAQAFDRDQPRVKRFLRVI